GRLHRSSAGAWGSAGVSDRVHGHLRGRIGDAAVRRSRSFFVVARDFGGLAVARDGRAGDGGDGRPDGAGRGGGRGGGGRRGVRLVGIRCWPCRSVSGRSARSTTLSCRPRVTSLRVWRRVCAKRRRGTRCW